MKMKSLMFLAARKPRMPCLLCPFVALLLLAGVPTLHADWIDVTWDGTVSITDTNQGGQSFIVWDKTTGKHNDPNGKLDAGGSQIVDIGTISTGDEMIIAINGQRWFFNASDSSYSHYSTSEDTNSQRLNSGTPFVTPDSAVIGSLDYMALLNISSSSFQISGIQLYSGIPLTYFNEANFDSAAAVAAGTLYSSIGTFTMNPDDAFENSVPFSLGTYDLMEVTGEQVLPGGGLGSPMTFNFADVPEPTTLVLLGVGGLALLRRRGE